MGHPSFGVWLERTDNGENGRRRSGCGGEVAGEAAGGELCAVGEAAEGAEAGTGGEANEEKARDGGFEVGVEDGGVFDLFYLAAKIGIKKVEPLEVDLVAGCRDDVIDVEIFDCAVVAAEEQMDAVFIFSDGFEIGAEVQGYVANDLALGEPAGGRSVDSLEGAEA